MHTCFVVRFSQTLLLFSLVFGPAASAYSAAVPLLFEPNIGQAAAGVRFVARTSSYTLLLKQSEAILLFKKERLRIGFDGANQSAKASGFDPSLATTNYFIGSDASAWKVGISTYIRVKYESLYPGIDVIFHATGNLLEYDFVVHPGADPSKIALSFESLAKPSINRDGDLTISVGGGQLCLKAPLLHQELESTLLRARYNVQHDSTVRLALGAYDRSKTLVIDPIVTYSSYLGGSDDEGIFGIQRDKDGNLYVSGETSSLNFPTKHPFQANEGGDYDVFISKFDPTGTRLIYSTYLGGSGYDHAVGLAVDSEGDAYLAGVTSSPNFPTRDALQPVLKGFQNAFVVHLKRSGSALVFGTYLGGSQNDAAQDITIDERGDIYVAGVTSSSDFPVTSGAFQPMCGGPNASFCTNDAFVTKMSSNGSKLLYSTFLGGSSYDGAYGIAIDRAGAAYVTGQTGSADYPLRNAFQPGLAVGSANAFVSKLNPSGSDLEFSTFLGGSGFDGGTGIALGPAGDVYVTGTTSSLNFPLAKPFQSSNRGGYSDGFISKFSQDGEKLLRSSYFGGSGWDYPFRLAIDLFGSVSVIGFTGSTDLSVIDPVQASFGGGNTDGFALKLLPESFEPLYATYLGGSGDEYGYGIHSEELGTLWFGGSTSLLNYPIRKAFQTTYAGGPYDAFLTRLTLTIPDYFRIIEDLLGGESESPDAELLQHVSLARTHFSEGTHLVAFADLESMDTAVTTAGERNEITASQAERALAASREAEEALKQLP